MPPVDFEIPNYNTLCTQYYGKLFFIKLMFYLNIHYIYYNGWGKFALLFQQCLLKIVILILHINIFLLKTFLNIIFHMQYEGSNYY